MKISILTLFPKMIEGFFNESKVKKALEDSLVEIELINLRDFAIDDYGTVDDHSYGGGAGMVLRADVIWKALNKLKVKSGNLKVKKILTSPKGKIFNQQLAFEYSKLDHLIIIVGHYEGIDERASNYIDEEVSLGDFILTGGEIVAATITDSVVRLIPGVLKKKDAAIKESFMNVSINQLIDTIGDNIHLKKLKTRGIRTVKLLEYPHFTRPEEFRGKKVPEVLLSGNHREVEKWRLKKAFAETLKKRPDLLS